MWAWCEVIHGCMCNPPVVILHPAPESKLPPSKPLAANSSSARAGLSTAPLGALPEGRFETSDFYL